jgi:hypothetical protein
MSEFLFLFRGGDKLATPAEMQAGMQKWVAWMNDLRAKGHFKAGQPLDDKAGKVVSGKKKAITDGPFAEAKDLVGGYMLIAARDLNEATELSMGCPIFERNGVVEVRSIMTMPA